ncbi:MAG: hypothetical protein ACOYNZ_10600 [Rhodoferax sp.]
MHFVQGSNVVVLQPEIQKAFSTSEAADKDVVHALLSFKHAAK